MNPRLRRPLIVIGLVTIVALAIFVVPRGLSLYYQIRGGQRIEYVLRFEEGIDAIVCNPLPPDDEDSLNEAKQGIADLNRAIGLNKNNGQAYYYLGKAHCLLGDAENAVENYSRYTEIRPENPLGYIGLGFAFEKLGDKKTATKAWQSANVSYRDFISRGDEEFNETNYDEAIRWYERAANIEPKSAESYIKTGKVYEAKQDYESALKSYTAAWDLNPEISTSDLVNSYKRNGDLDSIEDILQYMLENYPHSPKRLEWWETLGGIYIDNSNWNAAIGIYRKALNEYPENIRILLNLGWAYYESGAGVDQAIEEFNQVIKLEPKTGVGEFAIARVLDREERYIDADEYFQLALSMNPDANWWHLERGNASLKAKNYLLAIDIYKDLIERVPDYIPAYFGLAQTYQQANKVDQAVSIVDQALIFSESLDFNQNMIAGGIYEWAGENEKALNSYQQAFFTNPNSDLALEGINRLKK